MFSISFSTAGKGQFLTGIFSNNLCRDCRRQELLLTVAWGGKFYWLSPDKENTARSLTLNLTITLNINSMCPCRLAYDQTTSKALPRNLYQLQYSDMIHVCNWRTAPQADETWEVNGKVHAWGYKITIITHCQKNTSQRNSSPAPSPLCSLPSGSHRLSSIDGHVMEYIGCYFNFMKKEKPEQQKNNPQVTIL